MGGNTVRIFAFLLLFLSAASAQSRDHLILGTFVLDQWTIGDTTYKEPQVEGRFVLRDGAMIVVLRRNEPADRAVTSINFGRYKLVGDTYSYNYDRRPIFRQTPEGIKEGEQELWPQMRTFKIVAEDGKTRLLSESGEEMVFTPGGMTYLEKGKVLRVYRRSNEDGGVRHHIKP
jgi:hypothetical protein